MWSGCSTLHLALVFESKEMRSVSELHITIDRAVLIGLFTINICRCQSGRLWENGFFQHEVECSEKSLVLGRHESKIKKKIVSYIFIVCVCAYNIHMYVCMCDVDTCWQTDRQAGKTNREREIISYPIISWMSSLKNDWFGVFCVARWKQASKFSNLIYKTHFQIKTKRETGSRRRSHSWKERFCIIVYKRNKHICKNCKCTKIYFYLSVFAIVLVKV